MADPDPPDLPDKPLPLPLGLSLSKGCPSSSIGQSKNSPSTGSGQTEVEKPAPYRTRHDGWTTPRKRAFLHALARTGCVRDACRLAHISSTSAYRHRKRDAGFARAWERALGEALPVLEAAAFERAVEGVDEPIVRGGEVVATKKRYSDAILLTLLRRADEAAERCAAVRQEPDPAEAFEELKRRLAEMHRRGCKNPDCRECNG